METAAHPRSLFKPRTFGKIFVTLTSSASSRTGVVKTFRCANLALKNFEPEYRVDRKGRKVTATSLVTKRLIGSIDESAFTALLADDRLVIFENHYGDDLKRISPDDYRTQMSDKWRDHITDSDDFDLDDFTDGYCYRAQHWKGYDGVPVVILFCHH